jgi:nucleoside-diphosphate-sugar epimerase
MTTVVVTGSSGTLGQRVVDLLQADDEVDRIVGLDPAAPASQPPKLERRPVDIAEADLLSALTGADVVVHLAFSADAVSTDGHEATRVNVLGTERLLQAAAEAGVRQIVSVSSATVYGAWPTNPVPLTEDAPVRPNPEFTYAVQKAHVERLLADWVEDHPGVAVAVLRPVVVLGEAGSSWIARVLVAAAGLRVGETDPPMQFLDLDDLASAVDVARRYRLDGAYNVAPDGWVPGETARALAGGPPRVRLPERLATRLASWSWELRLGPIPPGLFAYTTHPWVVANDRLKAAGWKPQSSNEEAFVAGHEGSRWSTMSPKRRQELALGAAGTAIVATVAAVGLLARRAVRRRRARTS